MDEWNDWVVDNDPAEVIRQMRGVLQDHERSQEDKIEALTLLANLADDRSVAVLRWYQAHAEPGMEMISALALLEAQRLNRPPRFEPWHDALVEQIHRIGTEWLAMGHPPRRAAFRPALGQALRDLGWQVVEGGHALLKYEGQLVELAPLDLVVEGTTLVGLWESEVNEWEVEDDDEVVDPLELFYSTLRAANLAWGIQVDIGIDTIYTNMIENLEVDRGIPKVEYILALPN